MWQDQFAQSSQSPYYNQAAPVQAQPLQFYAPVDEVNRNRREKGKPDKYVDLTFTRTFGDRWVVFVNHYKYGRIGPTSGIGMEGKHSAVADFLELLQDKEKRVMGFLNFNVKAKL